MLWTIRHAQRVIRVLVVRSVGERGERLPVSSGVRVLRLGEIQQPPAFRRTAESVTASDGDFFFARAPVVVLHAEVSVPDFGRANTT
jgi:hypothetical protein